MPPLLPFAGVRFDPDRIDLTRATAPPYDVIGPEARAALAADPHNIVHADLPVGDDAYVGAAGQLRVWADQGLVVVDDPSLYVYATTDPPCADGAPARTTTGVLGALELSPPEDGRILPHELTTPKARSDRLDLLRATRTNLSAIWVLSPAEGLSELASPEGPPLAEVTDDEGVHHRLWRLDGDRAGAVAAAVAAHPVVVADGHHRLETSLTYRRECHESGSGPGGHDQLLSWVVELSDDQLDVQPIHRVLRSSADAPAVADVLDAVFDRTPIDLPSGTSGAEVAAMAVADGAPIACTGDGTWRLQRRDHPATLDTAALAEALALADDDGGLALSYDHDPDACLAAVGPGTAAVFMRPATVEQILAIAHGGERMPPKTTFFRPKPRTGLVWRDLDL
ncbi:MAG: DUF1015 domain-containing protein [Acidimicrobiia bacterium]|nr:DUF1015 domain-containing protein [Acidimicrobiia bacterium]